MWNGNTKNVFTRSTKTRNNHLNGVHEVLKRVLRRNANMGVLKKTVSNKIIK